MRGVYYSACTLCFKTISADHQKCLLMRDCLLFKRLLLPESTVICFWLTCFFINLGLSVRFQIRLDKHLNHSWISSGLDNFHSKMDVRWSTFGLACFSWLLNHGIYLKSIFVASWANSQTDNTFHSKWPKRPISQWPYYDFWFSAFCVFPSSIHTSLLEPTGNIK